MKASRLNLTGPECVKVGMNCLAPNEDAAYFMSTRLWLPDDRVYAVVGALGTQTGNATYVGLGLNSSVTQLGFANIDDDTLAGSADGYTMCPTTIASSSSISPGTARAKTGGPDRRQSLLRHRRSAPGLP